MPNVTVGWNAMALPVKRSVVRPGFGSRENVIITAVAGFWIFEVKSLEEAIEWVKRCPNPMEGESEIEIRQVFETADFGEAYSGEAREVHERVRDAISEQQG